MQHHIYFVVKTDFSEYQTSTVLLRRRSAVMQINFEFRCSFVLLAGTSLGICPAN